LTSWSKIKKKTKQAKKYVQTNKQSILIGSIYTVYIFFFSPVSATFVLFWSLKVAAGFCVLHFQGALQQNRAKSRLLYLFCDKEFNSNFFPTHLAEFSNQTLISKPVKVASA